ncbi:terminase large subunit domain-containing protein [Bradyrhizobium genosp. P]|uniref:terminase large subunit domain-containing protein n=1 Tax=Bradyrhizobium genosp. P TaxID=83641 RepID=UPI003CEE1B9E
MNSLYKLAYRLDPACWVKEVVGQTPLCWQMQFLRAPRGTQLLALTARQVGKTTAAAWAIAHQMVHNDNSLSVVACPAQRQSGEAVRRVRDVLTAAGVDLVVDNTYGLELKNRSRVLALPGSDDSIRGLSVDGWIIADEAARLSTDLIAAVRPMRARFAHSRFAMLSTAWSRTDPFWQAWESDGDSWIRLQATADMPDCPLTANFLQQERAAFGDDYFKREYLGIPAGTHTSPFSWELFDRATCVTPPLVPRGQALQPHAEMARAAPNPFRSLPASRLFQ